MSEGSCLLVFGLNSELDLVSPPPRAGQPIPSPFSKLGTSGQSVGIGRVWVCYESRAGGRENDHAKLGIEIS